MLNQKQYSNLLAAYNKNSLDHDNLQSIIKQSETAKESLKSFFSGHDTITIELPYTNEEYMDSVTLYKLTTNNPNWSFNFTSCQVTDRTTGHCHKLSKWLRVYHMLTPEQTTSILALCKQSHTLIVTCNPSFLLGSSVTANGRQLDSSCHYPDANGDYCSGPVSYALDSQTIGFFLWDNNSNGIVGRQIVYMDIDNNGFVCGRIYGKFTAGMSTHLRKHLYKNYFKSQDFKYTKHYTINRNDYSGYLDGSHFIAYRLNNDNGIVVELTGPLCLACGSSHDNGGLFCDSCSTDSRYTCDCCGDRIHEDDCYSTDYNTYCETCYYEKFSSCDHCGETCDKDDVYDCDGNWYCSYCAEKKNYYKCSDCGTYTSIDDITELNNELYCENCLPEGAYCDDCGQYEETKYLTVTEDDKTYCSNCADSNSFTCSCCDNTYSNDYDNAGICDDCFDNDLTPDSAVKQKQAETILDSEYIRTINGRSNDTIFKTTSYYTTTNVLTFHVTDRYKDSGYTVTESSSGMTSSRWYTVTIEQAINRLNQLVNDPAELQETTAAVERSGYKGTN